LEVSVLKTELKERLTPPVIEKPKKSIKRRLLIVVCILVFLYIAVPLGLAIYIFERAYSTRVESPLYSPWVRFDDVDGYERRVTNFYSGENKLQAYIYGEENDIGLIVMSHGIDWSAENYFAETMYFVDMGWRVFVFNNTGRHSSEGRGTMSIQQSVLDLDAALTYIEDQNWGLPIMLYGHSQGGYAVAAVLNKEHNINAVVSLAGFSTPVRVMHEVARDHIGLGIIATLGYPHTWIYNQLRFGRSANISAIDGINSGTVPVMIIHGTEDHLISYNGASIIAQRNKITNPNAVFVSRDISPNNGHSNLLRSPETALYIVEMNAAIDAMLDEYNGNTPDDILLRIFNDFKDRINVLDTERINEINDFFMEYLRERG
jgi:pimeloyl-ACP methyl ester carboxylesterase